MHLPVQEGRYVYNVYNVIYMYIKATQCNGGVKRKGTLDQQ